MLNADFQQIRDQLDVPRDFPAEVLAEADAASNRDPRDPRWAAQYADLRAVPFITLDPPGSHDLDQAFCISRPASGYLVRYAIADVGFFVARGGLLEGEAWRRGQTLYSPDVKTPLYPPSLSEGGASLLPGQTRPAITFTFSLDERAEVVALEIARSLVCSRAQLDYPAVEAHLASERTQAGSGRLAGHDWSDSLTLLEEVGQLRQQRAMERGSVTLRIPAQEVQRWTTALTGYRLAFTTASVVEEWNAELSLLTGMQAARVMIEHRVGLLRALDPPHAERVRALRLTAAALGAAWPTSLDYDDFVRSLDPTNALAAVMLQQAGRVTGGARYVAFVGEAPPRARHAAIAAPYAHATAPLRRLADRYVLDLLVTLTTHQQSDAQQLEALARLPHVMATSERLAHQLESAVVDEVEARLLQNQVGAIFSAVIIALRPDGVVAQITDPPIRTLVASAVFAPAGQSTPPLAAELSADGTTMTLGTTHLRLGQAVQLRLLEANPTARRLAFAWVQDETSMPEMPSSSTPTA